MINEAYLTRMKAALDREDADILRKLADQRRCQERLVCDGGAHYKYCGAYDEEPGYQMQDGSWRCYRHATEPVDLLAVAIWNIVAELWDDSRDFPLRSRTATLVQWQALAERTLLRNELGDAARLLRLLKAGQASVQDDEHGNIGLVDERVEDRHVLCCKEGRWSVVNDESGGYTEISYPDLEAAVKAFNDLWRGGR